MSDGVMTASSDRAVQLRHQVVDHLVADGTIVSAQVAAVMRAVPRELFAPGLDLEEVFYRYNGAVTKRDEEGRPVSSVSAPQVQAYMLEEAQLRPGMRCLEIRGHRRRPGSRQQRRDRTVLATVEAADPPDRKAAVLQIED